MANPSAFPCPSTGHGLQPHLMLSRKNPLSLREAIIAAAGNMGADAVPFLAQFQGLCDDLPRAKALRQIGLPAVHELVGLRGHHDWLVRREVAAAFGELGSALPDFAKHMVKRMVESDRSRAVVKVAEEATRKINASSRSQP